MVFAIQQQEERSLSWTSCSDNDSNSGISSNASISNNVADVSSPVVAMYDSFVPWISRPEEEPSNNPEKQKELSWLSRLFGRNMRSCPKISVEILDEKGASVCDPVYENPDSSLLFPPESHSLARFHLSCIQSKRHLLNFGRVASLPHDSSFFSCATLEIGTIVDFVSEQEQSQQHQQQPKLIRQMDTSDKISLLEAVEKSRKVTRMSGSAHSVSYQQTRAEPHLPWHPSHVRIAALGNHCRCVSWGVDNGTVTVYRLIDECWTAVAFIPINTSEISDECCRVTISSSATPKTTKQSTTRCPSMTIVSDIFPLFIPYENTVIALLIISRIGGFIEIHLIPSSVWASHTMTPQQRRRPAMMRLPTDSVAFIDPRQHHSDTICIEVHPSRLASSPSYGNHSSIHLTIVASGTSCGAPNIPHPNRHPVVSLWSVEIQLSSSTTTQKQRDMVAISSTRTQFIRVLSSFDLGGSDAQQGLLSSLRCCRVVADTLFLKRHLFPGSNNYRLGTGDSKNNDESDDLTPQKKRQCMEPTIEFSAPYIQLKVVPFPFPCCSSDVDPASRILITALDYYGSITFFNCAFEDNNTVMNERVQVISTASLAQHSAFTQLQWLLSTPSKVEEDEQRNHPSLFAAGVSQSGSIIIAKLQWPEMENGAIDYSTHQLKVVYHEQNDASASYQVTILNTDATAFYHRSLPFARCLISGPPDDAENKACSENTADKGYLLCRLCSIRELEPIDVAKQLVWAGKYQQAVSLINNYASYQHGSKEFDTDPIYKAVWEARTLDTSGIGHRSNEPLGVDDVKEYLYSIQDDDYVVHASLREYLTLSNAETLRAILREGLNRLNKLYRKDIHNAEEQIDRGSNKRRHEELIERRILCLGTYEWLSIHLGADFQLPIFFLKFASSSMLNIAKECALKGDIDALFMFFLRHGDETLPHRLELLSLLPPTLCPSEYRCLLPVAPKKAEHFEENAMFLFAVKSGLPALNLEQLILDFHSFFPASDIDVSDFTCIDRSVSLIPNVLHSFDVPAHNSESLASWYISHALNLELNGSSLTNALQCCRYGLENLSNEEHESKIGPEEHRLDTFFFILSHLNQCIYNAIILETMTVGDWNSLEVADAIPLILGLETDPPTVFSRWDVYVKPMINYCESESFHGEWGWRLPSDCGDFQEKIEGYIADYILLRCRYDRLCGLSICLLFACHSKPSLRRSSRIIRNDAFLIKLILDCIYDEQKSCSENISHVIQIYWDIYECLPARKSDKESSNPQIKLLHSQVDLLEKHLIMAEISSHYFVPIPLHRYLIADSRVFEAILTLICKSMCSRAVPNEANESQKLAWKEHATRFAVDLNELKTKVFSDLDLSIVEEKLFVFLLYDSKFFAFVELYSACSSLQDFTLFLHGLKNQAQHFIKSGYLAEADESLKYFSFLFPSIEEDLKRTKCLNDAAIIIRDVLKCPQIAYAELDSKSPFVVIEAILKQNPFAIVHDSQWGDDEYCKNQNMKLFRDFITGYTSSPLESALPGQIIHQLAMMLGLSTELDEFCVNQLMIISGIHAGLYGAAAAIYVSCQGFVGSIDRFDSSFGPDLSCTLLRHAILLVSSNAYTDVFVRKALCAQTLSQITLTRDGNGSPALSRSMNQAYSVLAEQCAILDMNLLQERNTLISDHVSVPDTREEKVKVARLKNQNLIDKGSEFLVFKAAEFVAKGAKHCAHHVNDEKKMYLHEDWRFNSTIPALSSGLLDPMFHKLFLDQHEFCELLFSLKNSILDIFHRVEMDDEASRIMKSTMSVIGRRILTLCISESALLRYRAVWPSNNCMNASDISVVVQLAVCLLLQSNAGSWRAEIALELQSQLEEEVASAIQQASESEGNVIVIPDQDIVKRLRHHGYSLNGARRAAIATGNKSFQLALSYAISNCQNEDFDLPILKIHSGYPSPPYVDQLLVHPIRDALHFLINMKSEAGISGGDSKFFSQLSSSKREQTKHEQQSPTYALSMNATTEIRKTDVQSDIKKVKTAAKSADKSILQHSVADLDKRDDDSRNTFISSLRSPLPTLIEKTVLHNEMSGVKSTAKAVDEAKLMRSEVKLDKGGVVSLSSSNPIVRPPSRLLHKSTIPKKAISLNVKRPELHSKEMIVREKPESSLIVPPNIRERVDNIFSKTLVPSKQLLGDEEKRLLAEQGRRLLEASRKAKLPSYEIGMLGSKSETPPSNLPSKSAQQNNTELQELQQSQEPWKGKQEGWDFDEDW